MMRQITQHADHRHGWEDDIRRDVEEIQTGCIYPATLIMLRGPFEKYVDWQRAALMQREAVTVMPSCSGGGTVVVA
jgi:hypothetical protein